MPFDDLLDEVWVCGPQIGAGWLIQLKLEAAPQLRHVEGLVPAPAHLQGNVRTSAYTCSKVQYVKKRQTLGKTELKINQTSTTSMNLSHATLLRFKKIKGVGLMGLFFSVSPPSFQYHRHLTRSQNIFNRTKSNNTKAIHCISCLQRIRRSH